MEENKVTEPVSTETKTEEKLFTQTDMNNIATKESRKAIERFLNELGVDSEEGAKAGLKKLKEMQDAQKSDLEKALEKIEEQNKEIATYKANEKSRNDIDSITKILKDKEIDTKYAKTIKKLMTDEINEESVMKTITEDLPMLLNVETVKIGTEKHENKPSFSAKDYLDNKYKDNPFYRK